MGSCVIHVNGTPRVSDDLGGDDLLWRYLDAAKFLDFIHNKTLFFSRGDQFEDKFEGAFTDTLKRKIKQSYIDNNIEFTYEDFRERLRKKVFINCWHRNSNDSMAMWCIYGKTDCAIALTTTVSRLDQTLKGQAIPYEMFIEKVEYIDHWLDPILDIAPYSRVFAYKANAYEFEQEVRIIIDRFQSEFNSEIYETGLPINIDPQILLQDIVIAPGAPIWFAELITKATLHYGINAKVRRSLLATNPL